MKNIQKNKKEKIRKIKYRERLYTVTDIANLLMVDPTALWQEIHIKKRLPMPKTAVPGRIRKYYTEKDFQSILNKLDYLEMISE